MLRTASPHSRPRHGSRAQPRGFGSYRFLLGPARTAWAISSGLASSRASSARTETPHTDGPLLSEAAAPMKMSECGRKPAGAPRITKRWRRCPKSVLTHALARSFTQPALAPSKSTACHPVRADRIARELHNAAARRRAGGAPRSGSGRRAPPRPIGKTPSSRTGLLLRVRHPVYRLGWHRDLWGAGPNRIRWQPPGRGGSWECAARHARRYSAAGARCAQAQTAVETPSRPRLPLSRLARARDAPGRRLGFGGFQHADDQRDVHAPRPPTCESRHARASCLEAEDILVSASCHAFRLLQDGAPDPQRCPCYFTASLRPIQRSPAPHQQRDVREQLYFPPSNSRRGTLFGPLWVGAAAPSGRFELIEARGSGRAVGPTAQAGYESMANEILDQLRAAMAVYGLCSACTAPWWRTATTTARAT